MDRTGSKIGVCGKTRVRKNFFYRGDIPGDKEKRGYPGITATCSQYYYKSMKNT